MAEHDEGAEYGKGDFVLMDEITEEALMENLKLRWEDWLTIVCLQLQINTIHEFTVNEGWTISVITIRPHNKM